MRDRKLLFLLIAVILSACGSDNDNNPNHGLPAPVEPLIGVFLDSPVSNISYTNATGSHAGVTNDLGEYKYQPGETMFFSIGDLEFPVVSSVSDVTTPMDMANSRLITNSKVLNMVRLLMTLDKDGNPENGITISETAKATQVDFLLSEEDFGSSNAVVNLIFNAGQNSVVPSLVLPDDALAHFEYQLLEHRVPYGPVDQHNDQEIVYYLEDNGLTTTKHESGIYYDISIEGSGSFPTASSNVTVKYTGTLLDGQEFDLTPGNSVREFELSGVIPGWQVAVPLLKPGGRGTFYIPRPQHNEISFVKLSNIFVLKEKTAIFLPFEQHFPLKRAIVWPKFIL